MANTVKEKVKVDGLSKFGFKVGTEYINFSKTLAEGDKAKIVPGLEAEMELYVADSGKRYVNKVLSTVLPAKSLAKAVVEIAAAPKQLPDVERAKRFTPKFTKKADDTMSKEEWAAKDVRISRQGVIQAAVQAVAPVVSLDKLYGEAEKLANQMLEFVNRR